MKVCDTTVKMLAKIIVCVVFLSIQIAEGKSCLVCLNRCLMSTSTANVML